MIDLPHRSTQLPVVVVQKWIPNPCAPILMAEVWISTAFLISLRIMVYELSHRTHPSARPNLEGYENNDDNILAALEISDV